MPKVNDLWDHEAVVRPSREEAFKQSADAEWPKKSGFGFSHVQPEVSADSWSVATLESAPVPPTSYSSSVARSILKQGHTVSYVGLFLFTVVLYFRPYELVPALSSLDTLAYWLAIATMIVFVPSQLALEGNLTARPRAVKLVLFITAAAIISIFTAINPSEAWKEFNDVFIKAVLMFIVMINVVRSQRRLLLLLYVTLAVTFLLSFNALADYRTGQFAVEGYRIKGLLGGMFGNPNDLALHFVTMAPLALTMMMISRRLIAKVFFAITAILIISGNVVTYSRGGFLGLVVTAIVIAWKLGRRKRVMLAVIGPIFLVAFIVLMPGGYGLRLLSIFVPSLDPVGSASSRQEILNRSIIVSLRHPITGIGMGNFHTVSLHETVTHNAFTQVSAEMGMAALIAYMMFLTGPILRLRRIERDTFKLPRRSRYYYLSVGLQASLIGYMVSAFFAAVAYQWYAYYLVAFGVCLCRMYDSDRALQADEELKRATAES
jgi:O-antigen ligase